MKRLLILLVLLLCCLGAARAEEAPRFGALTGVDALREALENGARVETAHYTDGYGFSTSEFKTGDPRVIAALIEALGQIEIVEQVNEDVTDWYPQIVFTLSDGSRPGARFDAHWLEVDGRTHYLLSGDEAFWTLTARLTAAAQNPVARVEYLRGGSRSSVIVSAWREADACRLLYNDVEYTADAAVLDDAGCLLAMYGVQAWNGFSGSDPRVLDGESFRLEITFADGSVIAANGSNRFPPDYRAVMDALGELFSGAVQSGE